jgi:hypothetical protein
MDICDTVRFSDNLDADIGKLAACVDIVLDHVSLLAAG